MQGRQQVPNTICLNLSKAQTQNNVKHGYYKTNTEMFGTFIKQMH